jgi:membrane associated rhomboid family serine protease
MFNLTPVVRNLLIVNVVIYFLGSVLRVDLGRIFGVYYAQSPGHELLTHPYTLFTYMFLHGNFNHLFSNMIGLLVFGSSLESIWGSKRFLTYYLLTGFGAGIIYSIWSYIELHPLQLGVEAYLQNPGYRGFIELINRHDDSFRLNNFAFLQEFKQNPTATKFIEETTDYANKLFTYPASVPMVGASGAIFGLIIAFGLLFPNREMFIFPMPFPIKAKVFVFLYGAMEIYSGIQPVAGDNVAHFAHLGGMLIGYLILKYWSRNSRNFY